MRRKSVDIEPQGRMRTSRSEEGRAFETRESEKLPVMKMEHEDPTYVPPEYIPEGYSYRWVRVSVFGQEDRSRMVEMKRRGWSTVPSSRHPDMAAHDLFGNSGPYQGLIEYKGNVLCERPKKYCDEERKYYEQKNYELITSMPGMENFMGDSSIPVNNMSNTAVGRSRVFS